jgi:hypothetical protein
VKSDSLPTIFPRPLIASTTCCLWGEPEMSFVLDFAACGQIEQDLTTSYAGKTRPD